MGRAWTPAVLAVGSGLVIAAAVLAVYFTGHTPDWTPVGQAVAGMSVPPPSADREARQIAAHKASGARHAEARARSARAAAHRRAVARRAAAARAAVRASRPAVTRTPLPRSVRCPDGAATGPQCSTPSTRQWANDQAQWARDHGLN